MVLKTYLSEFSKHLKEISFPTEEERIKESWDIQGVLKDKSNQLLKFDVRPIKIQETGELGKEGNLGIKADKFFFAPLPPRHPLFSLRISFTFINRFYLMHYIRLK